MNIIYKNFIEIEEPNAYAIGQRIQEARRQKGIRGLDLAVWLDISKNQLSRIVCGECLCTTKTLYKAARYLEVSADYLLYGKKEDEYLNQIGYLLKGKMPKEIEKIIQIMKIMVS